MAHRVLIVGEPDAETRAADEFRYLEEHRMVQVRRCFDSYGMCSTAQLPGALSESDAEAVLVLTSGRVMVTAASLRAMQEALTAGHDAAVPVRLEESGHLSAEGIDTLRQFEAVEKEVLSRPVRPSDGTVVVTPLSLWRRSAFESLLDCAPPGELPHSVPASSWRVGVAGVFHEFIDYYGHCRTDAIPFLPEEARDVLEIGSGRGLSGQAMQEAIGCRVTGVELNPVAASEARSRLHDVLVGDVESLEITERFDAIVALELIEHLVDPLRFLRRMLALLRPGGRIILSTPNVAYHAIIADLLAGRWDYLPTGTMCYTHLRFFTRSSLEKWLEMAGCESYRIIAQEPVPPTVKADWFTSHLTSNPDLATRNFFILIDR